MAQTDESEMYTSMRLAVRGIDVMYPNLNHITVEELENWMQSNQKHFIILDIRPRKEFSISHLEDAVTVDPSEEPAQVLTKIEVGDAVEVADIVCYCSVGYRSSQMAVRLQSLLKKRNNDTKVHNLRGGIFQWATQELPMKDANNRPTKFVHPYSFLFSYLVDSRIRQSSL